MARYLQTIIIVILTGLAPEALSLPELDQQQKEKLLKGELIDSSQKVSGTAVMMGKSMALIEDFPEAITYVLLDLDKYKFFLPRVTDSRVTKRKGWHTFAVVHTDLPWPVKDCWVYVKFSRYDKPDRVFEVKWWMLNGTMKNYKGSALIEPWDKTGKKTLITYQLLAEPKTAAPDSLISKGVVEVANTILKRLRLRLKALRKFNKLPKGL